jgi:DNA-binding response OmpR family regulator
MASLLLIDAHPASGRTTARLLACEGHRVMLAGSADAALAALIGGEFDLVLADPLLPDAPGMELLDCLGQVPVIILSTDSFNRTLWRVATADLREWLVKGDFSGQELLEAIEAHLPHQPAASLN